MSSCGEKCQMTSMITRSKNQVYTMLQDGLTTVLRWGRLGIRYQHELLFCNTIGNFFDMPKIFHDVADEALQTNPKVIQWHKLPSRMARYWYDQNRIWCCSYSCVHLVTISGQCDACLTNHISLCTPDWCPFYCQH